jgi:hypothetical protein
MLFLVASERGQRKVTWTEKTFRERSGPVRESIRQTEDSLIHQSIVHWPNFV